MFILLKDALEIGRERLGEYKYIGIRIQTQPIQRGTRVVQGPSSWYDDEAPVGDGVYVLDVTQDIPDEDECVWGKYIAVYGAEAIKGFGKEEGEIILDNPVVLLCIPAKSLKPAESYSGLVGYEPRDDFEF